VDVENPVETVQKRSQILTTEGRKIVGPGHSTLESMGYQKVANFMGPVDRPEEVPASHVWVVKGKGIGPERHVSRGKVGSSSDPITAKDMGMVKGDGKRTLAPQWCPKGLNKTRRCSL
jgi:hypothetical protein